MNDAIDVGDLVVVVGAACPHSERAIGLVLEVRGLAYTETRCPQGCCEMPFARCAEIEWRGHRAWLPIGWLRRIPPLAPVEARAVALIARP